MSQRLKDKDSLKISCEFVSGHHQTMIFTLIILWVWAWSPPNVHCWLTAWPSWLGFGEWVGGKKREEGEILKPLSNVTDSERKGVWRQHIIKDIALTGTEIPKHWFNSQNCKIFLETVNESYCSSPRAAYNLIDCVKKDDNKTVYLRAFLSHFRFWKGIWKVASWIGLEILILKHLWKS